MAIFQSPYQLTKGDVQVLLVMAFELLMIKLQLTRSPELLDQAHSIVEPLRMPLQLCPQLEEVYFCDGTQGAP